MSNPHSPPANVGRKRKRNVVDSSPPSEPAEPIAVDPQSTQQLFERVVSNGLWQAHEDDPDLDWRTHDRVDDDDDNEERSEEGGDNDGDEDEDVQASSHRGQTPQQFVLPAKIQQVERNPHGQQATAIHQIYKDFVKDLGQRTGISREAAEYTIRGLPSVVVKLSSIQLDTWCEEGADLAPYSLGLVVHVWLLVCFKMLTGDVYAETKSLSTQIASYFLAACAIVEDGLTIDRGEFKFAVEHWEDRLRSQGGDRSWLQQNLLHGIDGPDLDAPCFRNEVASEYLKVLDQQGLIYFALHVLGKECSRMEKETQDAALRAVLQQMSGSKAVLNSLVMMLFSVGTEMLKAIIEGQLQRKSKLFHTDIYNAVRRTRRDMPGCYMNSICDAQGNSPTPSQWNKVCNTMLEYVDDSPSRQDALAADIDQLIYPSTMWPATLADKGLRRYTEWRSYLTDESPSPSSRRRKMVRFFVSELVQRLSGEPGLHTPLSAPVVEVGFSTRPGHRLREHRRHFNSNYLMNLAEACFEYV
ncbi:MAG: hypothetical protein Q9191_007462 [Dirinaria sp. TL-2023a]